MNVYRNAALNATKAEADDSQVTIAGGVVTNPGPTIGYLQIWDLDADAVTVGTTPPTVTIGVPALSTVQIPARIAGIQSGLTVAATANADGTGGNPASAFVLTLVRG